MHTLATLFLWSVCGHHYYYYFFIIHSTLKSIWVVFQIFDWCQQTFYVYVSLPSPFCVSPLLQYVLLAFHRNNAACENLTVTKGNLSYSYYQTFMRRSDWLVYTYYWLFLFGLRTCLACLHALLPSRLGGLLGMEGLPARRFLYTCLGLARLSSFINL